MTREHLYAVILYCDFSDLCTAFSATFRRQNVFESMESVKQRHSKFAIFGKLLAELVLVFGKRGTKVHSTDECETGPFFCGLNCILNVGSYAITLRGPCSTSTKREVALNFAKSGGIILHLDNDTLEASQQKFFDCSWISNYFEESERLWMAGTMPLRIASIVIVRSAKNYQKIMRTLFLFDALISDVYLDDACKVKAGMEECDLMQRLIELQMSDGLTAVEEFDEYLKKEWTLFLQSKKEIIMNLVYIHGDFDTLSKVVVFDLVNNFRQHAKGNDNVFKAEWISIFPAVQTVIIDTCGSRYKFRLEALLDAMKELPRSVVTVIVHDHGEWIQRLLTYKMRSLFAGCGWTAKYKTGRSKRDNQLVFTLKTE